MIGWCLVVVYVGEGTESTLASFTFVLERKKGTENLTFGFDDNIINGRAKIVPPPF